MSDYKNIVYLCRKKDRRAQLEFYMMFYKSVYNSCYRILGNPQEAEEVMQESFLKVLEKTTLLQEDAAIMERFLKRIAINQAIDLYRKRQMEFIELDPRYDCSEEPEEENMELQLETIRQTLRQLPEGYRIIFTLHTLENMSYEDIARQLHLSASTVRSQYTRARQKLIVLLQKQHIHENAD